MKAFIVVVILVLFQCSHSVNFSREDICKKVDSEHLNGVDYNFCISTLRSDPKSTNTDILGFVTIATNIFQAKAINNEALAQQLIKSKNVSSEAKEALDTCVEVYGDAVETAKNALEEIKSNDVDGILTSLGALETDVNTCMDAWEENNAQPLMVKENDDADRLSRLALAIASAR